MNSITLFKNEKFGNVRIFIKDGEPWFVAKDIADILKYSETNAMTKRLDSDEVISDKLEGMNMRSTLINESGFYNAIIGSKLPEAKQFKKWVTSKVLPSIRKHGVYMTEDVIEKTLADPDFIIQLASQLKEEKQKRLLAEQQLEDQKPKVEIYDKLIDQKDLLNFKQVGDIFGYGRNKLFAVLRHEKILSDNGYNWNLPYAQYQKYFSIKIKPWRTNNGVEQICTTLCTTKAIPFIKKVLDKKKDLLLEQQVCQ